MKYSKFIKTEERQRATWQVSQHEVEDARVAAWRAVLEYRQAWTPIGRQVRLLLGLPEGLGTYHGTLCTAAAAAGMDEFVHMMNRARKEA